MADATRTLSVKWVGDTKDLEASAAQANKKVGGFGKSMGGVGKIAAGAFAGGAVLGGAQALVGVLGDSVTAAMEDEAAQRTLAKTLRNNLGATKDQVAGVEDWITKQGKLLGVTDDELRPALGRMALSVGDVGAAQQFMSLAMDISAGSGKDLQSVTEDLAKGSDGVTRGLKKYGIQLKDSEGNVKDFGQLQDELNAKFGGQAADAAETSAGKMKRLQLQFSEAKEELGAKLLPVLTTVMDFMMNKLAPAIGTVVDFIKEHWPQIMAAMQPVFAYIELAFNNIKSVVETVIGVFQGLIDFITGVFTGDWSKAWDGIQKIFGSVFTGIKNLITGFIEFLGPVFDVPFAAVKVVWETMTGAISTAVNAVLGAAGTVRNAVTGTINWLKTIFTGAWDGITNALTTAWNAVFSFFTGLPGRVWELAGKLHEFGAGIAKSIVDGITSGLSTVVNTIKGVVEAGINTVIRGWNKIDLGIHIHTPGILGFGEINFDVDDLIPDIKEISLATGGRTTADGFAFLHANEVVTPWNANMVGGGNTYNINVAVPANANMADVGRVTVDAIRAYERANGSTWRN